MKSKKLTIGLFIIYIIVLTWIILFKMQLDISLISKMNLRSVNLIPYAGSAVINGKIDISEIILNIAAFVPFGIYISMIGDKLKITVKIVSAFLLSLLYESLQFIFAIGASDITDLIGNTLGGLIGIAIFFLLSSALKEKTMKTLNILALIATISAIAFLSLLIIANL